MLDAKKRDDLSDKLGYEIEMLRIAAGQAGVSDGSVDPGLVELTSGVKGAKVGVAARIAVGDSSGSAETRRLLDAISALSFLACFKVLDVVVEWSLVEGGTAPKGSVGFSFAQKIDEIGSRGLHLPLPCPEMAWTEDVTGRLYMELAPFRHEVVHRHAYEVCDGILEIKNSSSGSGLLAIDRQTLGALARYVIALTTSLTQPEAATATLQHLMMYYADQLAAIHHAPLFGQKEPLRLRVRLTVHGHAGSFTADLDHVRSTVSRIHLGRDVLFDLMILAVQDGRVAYKWSIPHDRMPGCAQLDLAPETLRDLQEAPPPDATPGVAPA